MPRVGKQRGTEIICRSKDCVHNDHPICLIHTEGNPIIIEKGKCINYKERPRGRKGGRMK